MSEAASKIAAAHPDSIRRWKEFAREPHVPLPADPVDSLVPLYGAPEFTELAAAEKRRLYFYFTQWVAEFFIVLEGSLLIAFGRMRNEKAVRLLGEEYLHSQAFRRFLRNEKALGYPERRIFLHSTPVAQRLLAGILRRFPLAFPIPGAKIEAFSIAYARLLKQAHGSYEANAWTKLNHLHMLDEAHHVTFEFEVYNEEFDRQGLVGKLGTIGGTWAFYLFLQWILTTGCLRMMWSCLDPASGAWRRLRLGVRTLLWASYVFPPARHMRSVTKACYREKAPRWGRLIWFVCR